MQADAPQGDLFFIAYAAGIAGTGFLICVFEPYPMVLLSLLVPFSLPIFIVLLVIYHNFASMFHRNLLVSTVGVIGVIFLTMSLFMFWLLGFTYHPAVWAPGLTAVFPAAISCGFFSWRYKARFPKSKANV